MKKLIILIGVLLSCATIAVLINPSVAYVTSEGYVIESGTNLTSAMSQDSSESVSLHKLEADSMIYSSFLSDYDYNTKTAIDLSYPMYINNGTGLSFFNNNYTLVTDEFQLLDTYNGLFLSNGNTYNEDLSQADADDFYLVALENGLYMNAQTMVFKNQLYETTIPVNSIVKFQETDVRFFEYSNGSLVYTSIGEVYGATITIGEHIFDYADFLEALGLLSEAIALKEDGGDAQPIIEEILDILNIDDDDAGSIKMQSSGDDNSNASDAEDGTDDEDAEDAAPEEVPQDDQDSAGNNQAGSAGSEDDKNEQEDEDDKDTSDSENSMPGDGADQEGSQEEGEGSGLAGEGDGESPEPEYQEPVVSINNLDDWAYAIHGDLNILDNSGTIRRGVAVTIYGKITGVGDATINDEGVEVYSGTSYVGGSAKMRKTYYSAQEFTLSGLEPDTELYIQFTYSYSMEVEDEETGIKTYTTKYVTSDFYTISTQTIEDGDLSTIELSFDAQFATYSDRMALDHLYVVNDSDYVTPEVGYEEDDFDNFKLNVLPYISKLIFTFENDDPITITSTTIKKAMEEGGTTFTSSVASLLSNSEHKYTVTAEDKYGNELNLRVNGNESCQGSVFTAKTQPTITIDEVENITDKLTISITVKDEDGALETVNGVPTDLQLIATNTAGETAYLSGKWGDGSTLTSGANNALTLSEPSNGKTYTLELESLAFARTYTFSVYGNYAPQPDAPTTQVIANKTDVLFGSDKIYTAAITSGTIRIETESIDVRDTSADLGFTIEDDSTLEVLPLVDEIRISVTDSSTNTVKSTVTLQETELSQHTMGDEGYEYNSDTGTVPVMSEGGVTVELAGEREDFLGKTLWEAIMIQTYTTDNADGTTSESYSTPVQIVVTVADGTLNTSTSHTMSYEAIVIKSGIEYTIPVILSNSKFQTKKLDPIISMDDSFIANDVIEFINFDITDVDGTVTGNGVVEVRLYKGDALLQKATVYVADDPASVRFENLITGIEYTIEVVALAYNNDVGYSAYKAEQILATYIIEAGSDIKAEITLNYLEYIYDNRTTEAIFSMTGEECATEIAKTDAGDYNASTYDKWALISSTETDARYTNYIDITEFASGYDVIELEYQPTTNYQTNSLIPNTMYVYFYDSSYNSLSYDYLDYETGGVILKVIPDTAKYIRIGLGDLDYLTTWGFKLYGYTLAEEEPIVHIEANDTDESEVVINGEGTIVSNCSTSTPSTGAYTTSTAYHTVEKLAVTPGDVYTYTGYVNGSHTTSGLQSYIYLFNEDLVCVGYELGWVRGTKFVIPENIYYISFSMSYSYNFEMYKVADAAGSNGVRYEMSADINVYDKNKYLLDDAGNSTVTVVLERSDAINADEEDYSEVTDSSGRVIEMTPGEDGYYGFMDYLEYLDPNCSYRVSVKAIFQGAEITLTSETFSTDGAYIIVNDAGDFSKIYRFPYSNFLVMADFSVDTYYNMAFYGTIDFNGHTITTSTYNSSYPYIINTLGRTAVIKNLVFENASGYVFPIVLSNYGTIENLLLRTVGNIETPTTSRSLITYNQYGTVQSFVIELGGDISFNHSYCGLVCRTVHSGTVQDGYIYTTNGGAVIYKDEITYSGGVVAETYSNATVQNIYSTFDTYYEDADSMYSSVYGYALVSYDRSGSTNGMYHIGDFYLYEDYKKTTTNTDSWAIYRDAISSTASKNIWSIAGSTYGTTHSSYDKTQIATVSMLSDTAWQTSVLGDAFDIEGSVTMGYYPRLDWPTCMQQHQEYRTLPIENQSNTPKIVSDGFTEGSTIYNNSGTITLRMENPQEYQITQVSIESLVTTVTSQGMQDDGLYDVVLTVAVSSDTNEEAYLSAYDVTGFTYSNSGITKDVVVDYYTTSNIEFYKSVSSVADWISINSKMTWNYRLTTNIKFSGTETIGSVMINGSTSNYASTTSFTGKIDGAGYTISGITLENVEKPYVIYTLSATASIKNLYVEDVLIDGKTSVTSEYAGFIRYSARGSEIEDVHVTNITVKSSGTIGGLIGYANGNITNSTVNNVDITLEGSTYTVRIGGLAGYTNYSYVTNCYAKGVNIVAKDTNSVTGIGGLVGYAYSSGIYDCYAQGNIASDGKNIGGIAGNADHSYGGMENTYSDVDIDTISDNVGGIAGSSENIAYSNLAIGDIFAGSTYVNRVIGFYENYKNYYYGNFAYEDQTVNAMTSSDVGDAQALLTASELGEKQTWVDTMSFASQWDYSTLSSGEMPKLYYQDSDVLLPGQDTGIAIPGNEDISLTINSATINKNAGTYTVDATLTDANSSYEELVAKLENKTITFNIEGMAMTDDLYAETPSNISTSRGEWSYTVGVDTYGNPSVRIQITTSSYTHAYDTYRMTVTEGASTLTAVINYGESLYHTITSIYDWNYYMEMKDDSTGEYTHARSVENFKIAGEIDFGTSAPTVTNLMLGKLEGTTVNASFTNINFITSTESGGNWITSCRDISGIDFLNNAGNFDSVSSYQTMATLIGSVNGDFTDINIDGLTIDGNNTYSGGLALCYQIVGNIADVTVQNVTVKSDMIGTSTRSYAGSITAYLFGSYTRIKGDNITINCPYNNNVGGLIGYAQGNTVDNSTMVTADDISVTNITLKGYSQVGSVAGYVTSGFQLKDVSAENIDIVATGSAGGIMGYFGSQSVNDTNNIVSIKNSSVITTGNTSNTTYNTGGLFGSMYYYGIYYDLSVENVTIAGTHRVGGITGSYECPGIVGAEVLNCTITQYNSISFSETSGGVGGVAGYWYRDNTTVKDIVIRDTQISGDYNAGGVVGYVAASYRSTVRNVYIAEDVTITSSNDNAGGIFGRAARFYVYDVAIGAEVVARGSNAGGVVGFLPYEEYTEQYIGGTYIRGSVTALDNVAGIIGYSEDGISLTSSKLTGVIVAADLNSQKNVAVVGNYEKDTIYQSSNVAVWDNLLVNGQTLDSLYQDADAEGTLTKLPTGVTFCTAEDFLLTSFYSSYAFADYDTTYLAASAEAVTDDMKANVYMPFITCDGTTTVIPNTSSYNGLDVGILRPTPGVNSGATVVYTSGIDTLNIETTQDDIDITVSTVNSGSTYTYTFTDSDKKGGTYNVITIPYDFKNDITVDGVTYTADDFITTVMTSGSMWYYIDDSDTNTSTTTSLYYGGDNSTSAIENETVENPMHLWQGKALSSDGTIYYYSSGWNIYTPDTSVDLDTDDDGIYDTAVPLYDYTLQDVYYNFTIDSSNTYYGYRILNTGSLNYNVFVTQGMMYDSYILSDKTSGRYFALVTEEEGTFISYLSNIDTSNFLATGIEQMTNTFGYTASCFVTKYADGSISVVNFETGEAIVEVAPSGIVAYALYTVNGLANSLFGTNTTTDDSYLQSTDLLGTYESDGGTATDADDREVGTGETEVASGDSEYSSSDDNTDETTDDTTDSEAGVMTTANAGTGEEASGDTAVADPDTTSQTDTETSDDTEASSGTAMVDGAGESGDTEAVSDATDETSDTVVTASATSITGVDSEDGIDSNSEGGVTGSASGGTAEGSVDASDSNDHMSIGGSDEYTIAYNPYTGQYETFATSDISTSGTTLGASQTAAMKSALEEAASEETIDDGTFVINTVTSNILSDNERNGFILLAIIGFMCIGVVVTMNIKMRKHRK
ncbi:MAG: hypothetical protein R3Y58_06490 [Eubacteriales bacterium]